MLFGEAGVTVHDFFRGDSVDVRGLTAFFDESAPRLRIDAIRDLEPREQAMLFEAAKDVRPVRVADFVPTSTTALVPVIHYGRNSLPAFRFFQKRFCRSDRKADELWGYNEQAFRIATGPGYFVAVDAGTSEVVIDYTRIPPARPDVWPEVVPNSARLGRFIYHRTRDFMRGVSRHVTIGRATREGKPLDNWFVLCREG